jgi:hypothetical protein
VRCLACGRDFVGRVGAKYCSSACRQKAYRSRKRNAVTDDTARDDAIRRLGGMSSVTRDWLRSHDGPLLSVTVGFVKGEGMTLR